MFGKRDNHSANTTIIGRGARFTGTLELEGDLHIEGQCEGTIRAQTQLSVGPHGAIRGEISGGTLTVAGHVEGTIIAKDALHVLPSGSVRGEMFYGKLQVDTGGVLDGTTHQGPPTSKASVAPAAREAEEAESDDSRVIDARPKFGSAAPPSFESARSNAPARR